MKRVYFINHDELESIQAAVEGRPPSHRIPFLRLSSVIDVSNSRHTVVTTRSTARSRVYSTEYSVSPVNSRPDCEKAIRQFLGSYM